MLCEKGPANYIDITTKNLVYRNQFCAMCHGEKLDSISHPEFRDNNDDQILKLRWVARKLTRHEDSTLTNPSWLLMALKPLLGTISNSSLYSDATRFDSVANIECSHFADGELDFCNEMGLVHKVLPSLDERLNNSWNLGSVVCASKYPRTCDQFLIADVAEGCSRPGCGTDRLLDLQSLSCQHLGDLHVKSGEVVKSNDLPWHSHVICAYQSQCKLVQIGAKKEHELNCFCDKFCIYYNDCCEDSEHQPTDETKLEEGVYECLPDRSDLQSGATPDGYIWGIMQVNRCPHNYSINDTLKDLCEGDGNTRRGFKLANIPVTDVTTGLR